jgi:hypothetical protein
MILSDMDVELLAWCKPKIENAQGHSYICVLLEYAILEKFNVTDLADSTEALRHYLRLTTAITKALGQRTTVFMYLSYQVDGFLDLPSSKRVQLCALARMAWIDKMIETRTMA